MSTHGHARPPSPTPSTSTASSSDLDVDLDLDLEELASPGNAVQSGGRPSEYRSILSSERERERDRQRNSRETRESGDSGRIALRSLRMGLGGRRNRRGGAEEEDEEALLGGGEEGGGEGEGEGEGEEGGRPLLRRLSSRLSLRGQGAAENPTVALDYKPSKEARTVFLGATPAMVPAGLGGLGKKQLYPPNIISNHKFTALTFLPLTLYHEFSFFFNLYFLLVALSQIIPALQIGLLSSYIVPLVFVLTITLGKEAHDDIARRRRDKEANSEMYEVLSFVPPASGLTRRKHTEEGRLRVDEEDTRTLVKKSRDLKVGDILVLKRDQRVPADVVLLKTVSEPGSESAAGEAFIRTDQLDGETDWKLRMVPVATQNLPAAQLARITITASAPSKEVNTFIGSLSYTPDESPGFNVPLNIDNTAWANTVLASNSPTLAGIIYTGPETRAALSTSRSRSKTGLLEHEINNLTKILCALTLTLSIALVVLQATEHAVEGKSESAWYIKILRFLVLFSTIIPISLRVNLDMGKSAYAYFIEHDAGIAGCVVRTSTIPEELGRVEYLLSDKTGTLTQNDMELKKIHVGTVSYAGEAMEEVAEYVKGVPPTAVGGRMRREIGGRVRDVVVALALCHNVTPATEAGVTTYQASSPDEVAIVRWTESVGLRLAYRDRTGMKLVGEGGEVVISVKVLEVFPFTSEGKRMGIIVQFVTDSPDLLGEDGGDEGEIWFYQKGADTVMASIVMANDWLDEECSNMAREGLRTLVVGRKKLSSDRYHEFASAYKESGLQLHGRDVAMAGVVAEYLERDLELLGVTGVEDKLQQDVKSSLELLRNAGIRIWMLTGDKVETARCVAVSAKLVARGQYVHTIAKLKRKDLAYDALEFLRSKTDAALLIDGESLALFLDNYQSEFISLAVQLPAVIACRCTPTQKADIARLIRAHTRKRICCIGDGGNDVSMIQAADVGVGIVGKEGRQASLAADFSVLQFCHLTKLLVWHGRNSYKRSAKLAQFVMHRGLVISVCQTMYSIASRFEPNALYQGWLLVGYASLYTMMPVFSLVLDTDVDERLANLYPELYKELTEGRSLSYRTFGVWVLVSIYQGGVIQGLSQILVGVSEESFKKMVSVSFTVLVLNELVMVALEITTWHMWMIFAELGTAVFFLASIPLLGDYFDLGYVISIAFAWRVLVIMAISLVPPWVLKAVRRRLRPPSSAKVQGI